MGLIRRRRLPERALGGAEILGLAVDMVQGVVDELASLDATHVPELQTLLYESHRRYTRLHEAAPGMLPLDIEANLTSAFSVALPAALGAPPATSTAPYMDAVADGAHRLASPEGARELALRLFVSAQGEVAKQCDPEATAQWTTFYALFALACGDEDRPRRTEFIEELAEGLSPMITRLGDVPVLGRIDG